MTTTTPQKSGLKIWMIDLIAIISFLIIAAIFCYPWLQGNKLLPHDMLQWMGMSKESRDFYEATGKNAFWSNSMFGGMPVTMTDFYANGDLLGKLKNMLILYKHGEMLNPIMLFFWAMVSFYIFARSLKLNRWLGAIGAVAFAFSTYHPIIIQAGHVTKMQDLAFLPGMLAGVIWALKGEYWKGAISFGLFLAFMMNAAHYQIIMYSIFVVVAIGIAYLIAAIKEGKLKQYFVGLGILVVLAVLAGGTTLTRTMMTEEYNHYSMRGTTSELKMGNNDGMQAKNGGLDKDYAFKWSNGIEETLTLMVPNLYGGASAQNIGTESNFADALRRLGQPENVVEQFSAGAPAYWGAQQADGISGSVYFGATICFLAILALFFIRSNKKWWLVAVSLFFIMLSWGKNFSGINYALFDIVPLFNKFRSPNMAISIAAIMFPALAIWGLHDLITGKWTKEEIWKKFKTGTIIGGGLAVLILLSAMMFLSYKGAMDDEISKGFGTAANDLMGALRDDRRSLAIKDSFRSLVFIALTAAAIWAFIKEKISANTMIAAIALLVVVDVLPVAKRSLPNDLYIDEYSYEQKFAPRPIDQQIMQDKDPYYRVLDLSVNTFNDAFPAFFHKNVGGYHPVKLQIYQDMIQHQIGKLNSAVLNMLNTKYIITKDPNSGQATAFPNPNALGNAWFVSNVQKVATADDAMNALNAASLQNPNDSAAGNFNPRSTAVVFGEMSNKINEVNYNVDSNAKITLDNYAPNNLKFTSRNTQNGFAVFSDVYYPKDWVATIDGKEAEIVKVNYVLRGLKIPAGEHKIEFDFTPKSYAKYETFALIASVLLLLIILFSAYMLYRQYKNNTDDTTMVVD